jgi:Cof subfamily protein (haloacid dehalogenase superfamily)
MFPDDTFYLSDVDGTLLNSQGRLSTRSRDVLLELLNENIPFSVASARSYFSLRKLLVGLPLRFPVIEFNGAFITDFATGEHLVVNALAPEVSHDLFERICAHGLRPFVTSFNGQDDRLHYDELVNPGMVWYEERRRKDNDHRLRRTLNLHEALDEQVVSLTVMGHDAPRVWGLYEELRQTHADQLQLFCYENEYDHGNWWLTIHHPAAAKHLAMKTFLAEFAPKAQRLVAFGDNINDLEMLRDAHVGVAVANAKPELKLVASHVIGHQDEDAVAEFLLNEHRSHQARALASSR